MNNSDDLTSSLPSYLSTEDKTESCKYYTSIISPTYVKLYEFEVQ